MRPLIIGVAGGSGSGKSTVARNVAAALGDASVAFIDMDAYYLDHAHLPLEERKAVNWDHPNAFDWDLLEGQLRVIYVVGVEVEERDRRLAERGGDVARHRALARARAAGDSDDQWLHRHRNALSPVMSQGKVAE